MGILSEYGARFFMKALNPTIMPRYPASIPIIISRDTKASTNVLPAMNCKLGDIF